MPEPATLPTGPPDDPYATIPYPARAFRLSHPEHLATVAALFDFDAPPLETCRVLEIGCAAGGNLVPMADDLPGARLVGVDASAGQVDTARAWARQLGLKNIEFRREDLSEFGQKASGPPEPFDYVIAHGVYSWVAPAVRDKLLDLCARHLVPNGIAYVSYNVNPGWHAHSALRELMRGRAGPAGASDPYTRVRLAREAMEFVAASLATRGEGRDSPLAAAVEAVRVMPDANLLYDHLSEINDPVYFARFAEHAAARGLRHLADAKHPPAAGRLPRGSTPPADSVDAELLADVLNLRLLRQSLLVRADAPRPPRGIPPVDSPRVSGLFVASPLQSVDPEPELYSPAPQTFRDRRAIPGASLTTADPLFKSGLLCLADAWPARLCFPALLEAAWQRMGLGGAAPGSDTGAAGLADALLRAYDREAVELSVRPAPFADRVTARPAARRLARLQAESGDTVTTLRHDNLKLNPTARHLLRLLDGSRDEPALRAAVEKLILDNAAALGHALTLTDDERKQLGKGLRQDLRRFAEEGLLVG